MRNSKHTALIIAAVLILTVCISTHPGCGGPSDVQKLSEQTQPLRVIRSGGKVETITFARAMEFHHQLEEKDNAAVTSATPAKTAKARDNKHHDDHDDGLCVGVATGYQAIRYASASLFPGETAAATDLEMSVAGAMRGVWDIMSMHAGKKLARPKKKKGAKMSLESFTFKARRISTGRKMTFRLRDGLIPTEFFAMKNRGVTCGDAALETLKKQAARKILSSTPDECFRRINLKE